MGRPCLYIAISVQKIIYLAQSIRALQFCAAKATSHHFMRRQRRCKYVKCCKTPLLHYRRLTLISIGLLGRMTWNTTLLLFMKSTYRARNIDGHNWDLRRLRRSAIYRQMTNDSVVTFAKSFRFKRKQLRWIFKMVRWQVIMIKQRRAYGINFEATARRLLRIMADINYQNWFITFILLS